MKILNIYIFLFFSLSSVLLGDYVELYYNLSEEERSAKLQDSLDDSPALQAAIDKAGSGGGVYIPFGNCIVKSPVDINFGIFTILGNGNYASMIDLQDSGTINFNTPSTAKKNATYVIEDVSIIRNSGVSPSLIVSIPNRKNGTLKVTDVIFNGKDTQEVILRASHIDVFNLNNVKFNGGGMASNNRGVELNGGKVMASFIDCSFNQLKTGLEINDSYKFVRVVNSKFIHCSNGIVARNRRASQMEWVVMNSDFEATDKRYIFIEAPVSLSISDSVFDNHISGNHADILLNHKRINGVIATNSFTRGIQMNSIGKVGIIGNVFRDGFTKNNVSAHIIAMHKELIQMEGNLFVNKKVNSIRKLNSSGLVYRDVRVGPGGDLDRPITATEFDRESHPNDDSNIISNNDSVENLKNGSWICFDDFNFNNARSISIKAETNNSNVLVEARRGSPTGRLIASVSIEPNDSHFNHFNFDNVQRLTDDLYLVVRGGKLNNLDQIILNSGTREFE